MTETAWDADLEHPWASRWRIPRVPTEYPNWRYEVALVVPTDDRNWHPYTFTEPTEVEAEIIASLIEYRCTYYNDGWRKQMLERPFDVDGTTNTIILARTERGWKYRRMSFQHGLWPGKGGLQELEYPANRTGLLALLDHIYDIDRRWPAWKAERPVFAEGVAS